MVDFSDINNMKVTTGPTRVDRIKFRVVDLLKYTREFDHVAQGFIDGLKWKLDNGRLHSLTDRQEKWIYSLWLDLHMAGKVTLPKGMV